MQGSFGVTKGRIALNSLFSVGAWTFPILLGLVATPILVHKLGHEAYGVFAIILGFISYSFTFGIGKVAAKFVPEYRNSNENQKLGDILSATLVFSASVGIAGAVILALAAPFIVNDILLIGPALAPQATLALQLAAVVGLVTMISQIFQFALQGLHRFDSFMLLSNLSGLVLSLGNIALALLGYSVAALIAWNLVITAVFGLMFYLRSRSLLAGVDIGFQPSADSLKIVLRYGGNIILYQIFANAFFIFERSWVMRRFGAEALTFYFVPMLLATYMHGMISSFVLAFFPAINERLNDPERLRLLYQKATKIVLAMVVLLAGHLIAGGRLFLEIWVNAELAENSYNLLIIHSISFGLIAVGIMSLQLAESFRQPGFYVLTSAAWLFMGVPLMVVFGEAAATEGIALARLAGIVITFPLLFIIERRLLGNVSWGFWSSSILRLVLCGTALYLVDNLVLRWLGSNWTALVLMGIAGTVVYVTVLVLSRFFAADEWNVLRGMLKRSKPVSAGEAT